MSKLLIDSPRSKRKPSSDAFSNIVAQILDEFSSVEAERDRFQNALDHAQSKQLEAERDRDFWVARCTLLERQIHTLTSQQG